MNSVFEISIKTQEELPHIAKQLLHFFGETTVILLYGEMGTGKTTLIKSLCQSLGSTDKWSSPTYSIVNEYAYPKGKIFHFDLYRLSQPEELFDLGINEYLDSGNYCFVEWPQLLEPLVDSEYIKVELNVNQNIRYLRATKF